LAGLAALKNHRQNNRMTSLGRIAAWHRRCNEDKATRKEIIAMQLFMRSWNVLRGLFGRLVSNMERRHPEALLERERERFRASIAQFNEGLVMHATLSERLKSQIASGTARAKQIQDRLRATLRSGNETAAGRLALELKSVEQAIASDRSKFASAEAAYQQLLETRDAAVAETRSRLEELRFQIGDLKVNRAVADLETMAAAMVGRINDPGDGLNRLQEMVGEENEKARARRRVTSQAAGEDDVSIRAAERRLLEAEALAEFKAGEPGGARLALPDFSDEPHPDPRKRIKH
jgi:phage shock protein A